MDPKGIVSINPSEHLVFEPQKDGQLKAFLVINNTSPGNIAYKVKTTAPKFYVVKPNQGILDRGMTMKVDITLIPAPENKIEENKFLVQVAPCEMNSSETYALNTFWEKLDKKASVSFKLRVSILQGGSGTQGPSQESPKEQQEAQPEARSSLKKTEQPVFQQQNTVSNNQFSGARTNQQFEKAPDDEINQSRSSVLNQSQQPPNVNQEAIKKNIEELKKQIELVQMDKSKIQKEINDLKSKSVDEQPKDYQWQQEESKGGMKFQLIHLLIAAIIFLLVGRFLGSASVSHQAAEQPVITN